jgi:multidrug efflux pump
MRASYLSQLKFDPSLKNKWWAKYLINFRLVLLLIVGIIAAGSFSYFNVPKRVNPEVKIPIVVVSSSLPGANSTDIESLLTIPLEDKLDSVKGIERQTSVSQDNVSVITLQFLSSVDGDRALADVQRELGGDNDLPDNATDPEAKLLDFEDQPIWTFAVTGKGDSASLMRFSSELKDELENQAQVDRVEMSGYEGQEVQIIVDPKRIAEYGISPNELSQIVKRATSSYPAGTVENEGLLFSLSIEREVSGVDDVRNLLLTTDNGRSFRLGDVASVMNRSKINQQKTYLVRDETKPASAQGYGEAKQAVQFFVYKTAGSNIDAAEIDARSVVERKVKQYGGEYKVTTVMNSADETIKQFNNLFRELGVTVLLVFLLLVVFLGMRLAVIALLTIPLTLLSTMVVINSLGLSLNFLTVFAFLIALGLLIDDTIVSVAAMTRYYRTGKFTPAETAMLVWRDFIVPLWAMTITVIWAFVPLLLASGIIGEFIKTIPIVVTATMISSTSIAVFITLPVLIVLLKPQIPRRVRIFLGVLGVVGFLSLVGFLMPKSSIYPVALGVAFLALFVIWQVWRDVRSYGRGIIHPALRAPLKRGISLDFFIERGKRGFGEGFVNIERVFSDRYKALIARILASGTARRNTIIAIVVFAVVGYMLVPLGLVKTEFFPKTDEDILYAQVDLPSGTSAEAGNSEMREIVKMIKPSREVSYYVVDMGASLGENGERRDAPGSILMTFHLNEERSVSASQIAGDLREQLKGYTKGTVNVVELSGGPPAGSDIQISIRGEDLEVLNANASKIQRWLKKQPGVTNVQNSYKPGTSKLVFVPDRNKLAEAGVSVDELGVWLRTYASGFTLDTIKLDSTDTDIIFLMDKEKMDAKSLSRVMVPTSNGSSVPLLSLGKLELKINPTTIVRQDGLRDVAVSAGVTAGTSATSKNKEVEEFVKGLDLPEGYSWKTGGVNEENQKSVQSILVAMLLSFMLILVTMVVEFGSFRKTLIALLIIPLGITGVFYVFGLTGTPLSFPALIGILALFGIVVRHVIMVIEKINDNIRHGMELTDALVDAAGSRLEPILLTSMAAIVGLIPITVSDPLWRGLGGAIIAGLIFSGVIKLFFVPVVYYEWFKERVKDGVK